MAFDEELARRVRRVLDGEGTVTEKHMFGGVAFMLRGHMCAGIVGDSLMVRTGSAYFEALLDEPHARPMDFTGRAMRGFLFVDPPGLTSAKDLRRWVGYGVATALALPKKSPKRKAKAARRGPRR
jgi:TfoX/Sxy family transcriptional regulator of competence genes